MKTTLVRPATFTTTRSLGEDSAAPIGIAYLAACLQQSGHYFLNPKARKYLYRLRVIGENLDIVIMLG